MSTRLNALPARLGAADAASRAEKRNLYLGIGAGLLVVVCWATWAVATRFAVTTHLGPLDVALLRYLVSSFFLAPVLWRHGLGLRALGVGGTLLLVAGAGLPFVLVSSSGLRFAPASDVGAVMIATMPVFVAVFSAVINRERFDAMRVIGFAAVALGVLAIAAHGLLDGAAGAWRGQEIMARVGVRTSGKASSIPVMRMIRNSDGRAAVSLSERPDRLAYPATRASTPRPAASQKVSSARFIVTGPSWLSTTSRRYA